MNPLTLLSIACALGLFVCVALCAMWAWSERMWLLAVPLTVIFVIAAVAMVWLFEVWGT